MPSSRWPSACARAASTKSSASSASSHRTRRFVARSRQARSTRWSCGVRPVAARPRWRCWWRAMQRRFAEVERDLRRRSAGLPASARKALAEAEVNFAQGRQTVLFVDEVHRFNKTQQDAFLPHIEKGVIIFIGATTENPSFELNSALQSRCRVHVLEPISTDDIIAALKRARVDSERQLPRNRQ
ncbi:MAG: hypothetical protein WDW38_006415 [Sanguina aurantia]